MQVKFDKIYIYTKDGDETLFRLSRGLTFIYGNIGVGKSTLINLMLYSMGGKLIETPAVHTCLSAVRVEVMINGNDYAFYREVGQSNVIVEEIRIGARFKINVNSISKFILDLCHLEQITIAREGSEKKEINLSFNNFVWFSYLRQNEMDSVFFNLDSDNYFKKVAAMNVILVFMKNDLLIEPSYNKYYRELKKKLRQYEEGKEVFNYLSKIFADDISETEVDRKILKYTSDLEQLMKLSSFDINIVEEIIQVQKLLDELNIRKKFNYRKKLYLKREEGIKEEMLKINDKFNFDISKNSALIKQLGDIFLDNLLQIGFPGITDKDCVRFNSESYLPVVYNINTDHEVSYENLGSGGKRNLFKICFAIAIHRLHVDHVQNNYLPSFLIIDTPMKNISEREDVLMYDRFYKFIFRLFSTELEETQLIIVDKEKRSLADYEKQDLIIEKHMSNTEKINPPLFRNYRGF